MKVFITGGTGLVGSHVADLLRESGREVVCLQRASSDTTFLRSIGCRIVVGDVRDDPERIADAMAGCDRVLHAAALVYSEAPWPRIRAVNVEGTERVLRAAALAGIPRAVHLSSVAVYGDAHGPLDESSSTASPLRPADLYARSKREAEEAARAVGREERLDVFILRPSAVYGERDRIFTPRLATFLRWPLTPLLGHGESALPAVYAGNVAAAVLAALARDDVDGRVFNVGEDFPLTQREMMVGLAGGLGVRPRFFPIPPPLVRWGARLGDTLGIRPPGARDLSLSRIAHLAMTDNPFVTVRARSELGWAPPFRADEALFRTGDWLRGSSRGSASRSRVGENGEGATG